MKFYQAQKNKTEASYLYPTDSLFDAANLYLAVDLRQSNAQRQIVFGVRGLDDLVGVNALGYLHDSQ